MNSKTGMAITNRDFDGDGDLDLIISARDYTTCKIYFFENDRVGNLNLGKQYSYSE